MTKGITNKKFKCVCVQRVGKCCNVDSFYEACKCNQSYNRLTLISKPAHLHEANLNRSWYVKGLFFLNPVNYFRCGLNAINNCLQSEAVTVDMMNKVLQKLRKDDARICQNLLKRKRNPIKRTMSTWGDDNLGNLANGAVHMLVHASGHSVVKLKSNVPGRSTCFALVSENILRQLYGKHTWVRVWVVK